MAVSQIYAGIIRHRTEQRFIDEHCRIKVTNREVFIRVQHFKLGIIGFFFPQLRGLTECQFEFLALAQYFYIIEMRADIVGRKNLSRFQ